MVTQVLAILHRIPLITSAARVLEPVTQLVFKMLLQMRIHLVAVVKTMISVICLKRIGLKAHLVDPRISRRKWKQIFTHTIQWI